ncbi:MAG: InlB B-repeat-containing protein [Pseudomonadota bacterium]
MNRNSKGFYSKLFVGFLLILLPMVVVCGCKGGFDLLTSNSSEGGGLNTYTVTYDGNYNTGGTAPTDTTTYVPGQIVTIPGNAGNLARTDYAFSGWNTRDDGGGTTYTQGQTFTIGSANVTLYARWTNSPTYTVTYDGNTNTGGAVPTDTTNYEQDMAATVLANTGTLVKAGSTFSGWNTQANGGGTTYTQSTTITIGAANVTLYAKWTTNPTYTVTYDGNANTGGTVPADLTNYENGQIVTVLANTGNLVKTNSIFAGWNTQANGGGTTYTGGQTFAMGAANRTLYAQWTPTYTVTYNDNVSTGGAAPADATNYENGQTVTVLGNTGALVKDHFTFSGWNTQAGGGGTTYAPADIFAIGAANVTLYARWTANPTYTVTYNGNGNTGGAAPADGNNYETGDNVTVLGQNTLVRLNFTFANWNTQTGGGGDTYAPAAIFAMGGANVTLFAQWTADPTYTVTYHGNTNTGGAVPVDLNNYWVAQNVTVLGNTGNLVKAGGYAFEGWNTAADVSGTTYAPADVFPMGGANVDLYAIWAILTPPTLVAIRTQLGLNNTYGMVVGQALGAITLPVCTPTNYGPALTYSIPDLPAWLTFTPATRAITVNGGGNLPAGAYTAASVTYTCEGSTDPTLTANQVFTINDLDGGGVTDGKEYIRGAVPLLNNSIGWIFLTPANLNLYRTSTLKIPTGLTKPTVGMVATNAADDTANFDGDASTNDVEIAALTDIFVATSVPGFAAPAHSGAGIVPQGGIATADFDGDGKLDLAVTDVNLVDGATTIYLGNGAGAFVFNADYGGGGKVSPVCVVAADFNGNGNMDMATVYNGSGVPANATVSVRLGAGDGTFGAAAAYAAGNSPYCSTAADFDGDGDVDLAVTNFTNNYIAVLINNGAGVFAAPVTYNTSGVGSLPWYIVAADFNNDGNIDLATENAGGDGVSVWLGVGNGTFNAAAGYEAGGLGAGAKAWLISGDFNGDGNIDLAALSFLPAANVSVLLGNGDGTFLAKTDYPIADGDPRRIIAADIDGDNDIDLAVGTFKGADWNIALLLNNGTGIFATSYYDAGPTIGNNNSLIAADFDKDGKVDLAITDDVAGDISVLLQN